MNARPASGAECAPENPATPRPAQRSGTAWAYLARCADGTLYAGWTKDTEKRIAAHNAGRGARYTRARLPVVLAYRELCAGQSEAMRREAALKKLSRREKEALCAAWEAGAQAGEREG